MAELMIIYDALDGRLKDKVKTLTDEDWEAINRVAYTMCMQNHGLTFRVAEANAMLAIIFEKEKGQSFSSIN